MATGSIRKKQTKNGDIRYQITVEGDRDPLTGKRNRTFKNVNGSLREAKTIMHKMITEMEQNLITKRTNKTVGEWIDEWLEEYMPNLEETTKIGYRTKIRCYIKPAIGHILLKSLRAEHVQKMANEMTAKGLSPKNVRDTYNNINAAMKTAVKTRLVPYNPCEGVSLPKLKKYRANVYSPQMIHNLLDKASGTDMYLPIMLLVTVGFL